MMWDLYDPAGSIRLPAAAVLAPMYTAAWRAGPWLNTAWAYTAQLAAANPAQAGAIDALANSLGIGTNGDDDWGSTETNPGDRTAQDALPPYDTVTLGGSAVTLCTYGSPNSAQPGAASITLNLVGQRPGAAGQPRVFEVNHFTLATGGSAASGAGSAPRAARQLSPARPVPGLVLTTPGGR